MQTKVDIINALDTLNPEQMNKVAIYITDIRRAGWAVVPATIDEPPFPAVSGHAEGFKSLCERDKTTPMPLGQAAESMDAVDFILLLTWADKLGVPHDEDQWLDDEWPQKEDDLRVLVAEAMEMKPKTVEMKMNEDKCTDREAIVAFDFRLKKIVTQLLRFRDEAGLNQTQQDRLGKNIVDFIALRYQMRKQAGILDE